MGTTYTCSFCWKQTPNISVCGQGEDAVILCDECAKQVREAAENRNIPLKDIKLRNPQELCVQCGLCCFMLTISVSEKEAQAVIEGSGLPEDTLFEPKKESKEEAKTCACTNTNSSEEICKKDERNRNLRLPCPFLGGNVLKYTFCKIYKEPYKFHVCHNYLCRTAISYALRVKSHRESAYLLRAGFLKGDVRVFNFGKESMEDKHLQRSYEIVRGLQEINKISPDPEVAQFLAAQSVTRRWFFRNPEDNALFSMHMEQATKKNFDPALYIPHSRLDGYSSNEKEFASEIIGHVMEMILDYVEPLDGDILDELKEETIAGEKEADVVAKARRIAKPVKKQLGSPSKAPFEIHQNEVQNKYEKLINAHKTLRKEMDNLERKHWRLENDHRILSAEYQILLSEHDHALDTIKELTKQIEELSECLPK